jgi:uncharacterized protein YbaR (Trm112 family)
MGGASTLRITIMLHKNIYATGLLRTLTAMLGSRTIRLIDGLCCPHCRAEIRNYPEETDAGWRLLCPGCHGDLLVVEDEEPAS